MGWQHDRSRKRIQNEADRLGEIEVKKLGREMELANLSVTRCREIFGAHLYIPVSNFPRLVCSDTFAADDYKRLIRCVHCYQRELSRMVETDFGDVKVHFQGPKLHALCYRPIDDATTIARHAALLGLAVGDFVRNVFNPFFDAYPDFEVAAGIDMGNVIATKNGTSGDRELLFLGGPANHAAKIVGEAGVRLTGAVYEALPKDLQEHCTEIEEGLYRIQLSYARMKEELADLGIGWTRELSAGRLKADKESLPLREIAISGAETLIDPSSLSARNNKKVVAVSLFGDVTGFTAHIDSCMSEADRKQAIRTFHLIRKEMRAVVKEDYPGVRIQYQGDRVQALFHLPADGATKICDKAVRAASALQSAMETTLKACLPDADELHMATGVDFGTTLVSNLGQRGQRDTICLAEAVEEAARIEEWLDGEETGISSAVRENLSEALQSLFTWDSSKRCYVVKELSLAKLEDAEKLAAYSRAGAAAGVTTVGGRVSVAVRDTLTNEKQNEETRVVRPARSWHP
jgi:class 3 adenylate cyclase